MAKNPKWTEAQLDVVRKHYLSDGTKYCAKILGKTESAVHHKSEKLRLLITRRSFNIEAFRNVQSPEVAYILGILWADGYVSLKECKVVLSIVKKDLDEIVPLFMKTGEWSYRSKIKLCKRCTNLQASLCCHNGELIRFLETLDYRIKSGTSPSKVLQHIPDHLKHYWWRGYFDGDGCLCIANRKSRTGSLTFSSVYNQDWTFFGDRVKSLGIQKFHLQRVITPKGHRYSAVTIRNIKDIEMFMRFIYLGKDKDSIGFSRKYQKWLTFILMPPPKIIKRKTSISSNSKTLYFPFQTSDISSPLLSPEGNLPCKWQSWLVQCT